MNEKGGKSGSSGANQGMLGKSELNNGKLDEPRSLAQPPKCPECGNRSLWKDGLRYNRWNDQATQRWLCRNCGFRFSQSFTELKQKLNITCQGRETSDSIEKFPKLVSLAEISPLRNL